MLAALLILCGGSAAASHLDCTSKGAREVAWDVTGYGRASPDTVPPPRPCSSACQTAIDCRKTLAACDGARSEQLQPHTLDLPTNSCSTAMCSQKSDRPTAHCSTTDASAAPHASVVISRSDTPLLPWLHRTCRHSWPAMCPLQLADSEPRPTRRATRCCSVASAAADVRRRMFSRLPEPPGTSLSCAACLQNPFSLPQLDLECKPGHNISTLPAELPAGLSCDRHGTWRPCRVSATGQLLRDTDAWQCLIAAAMAAVVRGI